MTRLFPRRGLRRVGAALVVSAGIVAMAAFLRSFQPPSGRPTAISGVAAVSLETSPPTAEQLRSRLRDVNVIIVVADAARADRTGVYGYPRDTTPNLDRIAAKSVVFEQHIAAFPHTRSSTCSLFTGLYPDTHGVRGMQGGVPEDPMVATVLKEAGFDTAFFSSWLVASPTMGIGQDFDFINAPGRQARRGAGRNESAAYRNPAEFERALREWVGGRKGKGRFFVYVHFLPPHRPYNPPEEMRRMFAGEHPPYLWRGRYVSREIEATSELEMSAKETMNLYDANYRYADAMIGEFVKALADDGLLENTLLIITSDHGEAFGEHGYVGHRDGLYDELVHIPLVIRFPGEQAPVGRVRALTSTVDIFPTLLDIFALPLPADVQGHSLLPLLTGESEKIHDCVFARAEGRPKSYLVRDQQWAMLLYEGGKLRALYDLENDPWQTRNVIDQRPEVAEQMVAAFEQFAKTQRYPPLDFIDPSWRPEEGMPDAQTREPDLTDQQRRELEALGYLR